MIEQMIGKSVTEALSLEFFRDFCYRNNIVYRILNGKRKKRHLLITVFEKRSGDSWLHCVRVQFKSCPVEAIMENMYKSHFFVDHDNEKCLNVRGENDVSYYEISGRSLGLTICVQLLGEPVSRIESALDIFKNDLVSYLIQGISDDIDFVSYRSGLRAWIDGRVLNG